MGRNEVGKIADLIARTFIREAGFRACQLVPQASPAARTMGGGAAVGAHAAAGGDAGSLA
ncbi:MAG: hypothetical protein ISS49_02835 [Anaerolineae bacterium]|nr:hypothetical protein [Anaerolineae bacterium]